MSGSSGNSSRGCTVATKKIKRLCHENQGKQCENSCRQIKEEKRYLRSATRGHVDKWTPLQKSTPGKLKRSTSLLTMSPQFSSASDSSITLRSEPQDEDRPNNWKQDLLGWKVLYSFSKNLGRKRKQHMEDLNKELEESDEAAKKLNIQISVLKNIIKNDETVMELWKKQLHDCKHLLGSTLKEYDKLKIDFEEISASVEKMKERVNELETANNNYKNTELLLKSECCAFEEQLEKERNSSSSLKSEFQLQMNKCNDDLQKKMEEIHALKNKKEELEKIVEKKSTLFAELECNFKNNTRLFQNSVKEIQQLNREMYDLRRTNKLLKDEISSMKNAMTLLENNQQQIYKYFNMHID